MFPLNLNRFLRPKPSERGKHRGWRENLFPLYGNYEPG
jgi:hypothetical protein